MKDLRSEVRDAFAKEQAKHPPAVRLRHDIVSATALTRRPQRNYQWIAVAAAVAIAALVVAGLLSSRLLQRATVPGATPGATPSASPSDDYGPPPAGVKLLYVAQPDHDGWLTGFDWTGKPRGTVKVTAPETGVLMAPDGQSFSIGINAKGGSWQFLDRVGKAAGSGNLPGAYSPMWADDDLHVCAMTMDQQTLAYNLWTALPGENPRLVLEVARDPNVGQTPLILAACSFGNDRAIVVRTPVSEPAELWVIRLSDGKVLAHHAYEPAALSSVVASSDAKYVAETSWYATVASPASGTRTTPPGTQTWIRRVDDWKVLASIDPSYAVLKFSGDGTRILVRTQSTPDGTASHVAVFKWTEDGNVTAVWTYEGKEQLLAVTAEPGGDGVALGFVDPADTTSPWCGPGAPACKHLQTIVIVRGTGAALQLSGRYNPTW